MYDTISELNIVVSASRWISLLWNYFISCSPSVFIKKNLPKQASARSVSLHSSSASKGAVSVFQEQKYCEQHTQIWRLPGKASTLLHIYSKGTSTFKTALSIALFPGIFWTPSGIRSLLHRRKFTIRNLSCFL